MHRQSFDLIVIGSGPSASTVAKKSAAEGKKVAVIESRDFGGVCALRGCNPKKVYANAADLIDRVRGSEGKLINFDRVEIDWESLHSFKREFTSPVPHDVKSSFEKAGIELFHGTASFSGPTTVAFEDHELSAERFFIGTGSCPRPLQIEGAEHAIHSDDFFEMTSLPQKIAFVGGGYISMEFASVAARQGAEVIVLQSGNQILPPFDSQLVEILNGYCEDNGIRTLTNCKVTKIEKKADDWYAMHFENGSTQDQLETSLVVHGAGRVPNLVNLNLEKANVEFSDEGIRVNESMQSCSNPSIFAAGDCAATGQPALTPTANEEARIVAKSIFNDDPANKPDYGVIPQVAFTVPPIARVGMTEAEAKSTHNVDVRFGNTSDWGAVRKSGQRCAGYKILIDKDTDKILGAHLLGPGSEEAINIFALAMKFDLTATDIKSTLFAYPTFVAEIRRMV